MERNQIIGVILICASLIAWSMFNAPSEAELKKSKRYQDSVTALKDTTLKSPLQKSISIDTISSVGVPDSISATKATSMYGSFAPAMIGKSEIIQLENDFLRLTFDSKGGTIKSALLKKHVKTVTGKDGKLSTSPVILLDSPENKFEYVFQSTTGKPVKSSELFYQVQKNANSVTFIAKTSEGGSFEQTYTLPKDDYILNYEIATKNLGSTVSNSKTLPLHWSNYLPQNERGAQFEQNYSTAYYKEAQKQIDYCNCVKNDAKDMSSSNLEWIANVNQFFNTSLIPQNGKTFSGAKLATELVDIKATPYAKHVINDITIPWSDFDKGSFGMKMYIGPNEFSRLQKVAPDLEEIIPFGSSIFGTINRWFIRPFFDFLSSFIGSKGLVIIALIFLIKMLLYPLMYKTLHSQAKMAALKPEIDELKKRNKDDAQKQQVETMKLYQEYGVSPLGGCLPMLLQAPIWYALFRFFPASITFRQEPFLWATDLSSYDVLFNLGFEIPFFGSHVSLFTLLWAVSTIVYTYYSMQNMDMSANPAMKYVQYFMPVMFLAFFNNYASGLTCYMFFSNMINIMQTIGTKKYIFDEEKIRKELLAEKSKPKKKGGFQARLEEAMKQQQAVQESKKKNKK